MDSFQQVVLFSEQLFKVSEFLPKVGRKGASRCDIEETVYYVEEKDQEAQETKKGVWVECIPELKIEASLNLTTDQNHPSHSMKCKDASDGLL